MHVARMDGPIRAHGQARPRHDQAKRPRQAPRRRACPGHDHAGQCSSGPTPGPVWTSPGIWSSSRTAPGPAHDRKGLDGPFQARTVPALGMIKLENTPSKPTPRPALDTAGLKAPCRRGPSTALNLPDRTLAMQANTMASSGDKQTERPHPGPSPGPALDTTTQDGPYLRPHPDGT